MCHVNVLVLNIEIKGYFAPSVIQDSALDHLNPSTYSSNIVLMNVISLHDIRLYKFAFMSQLCDELCLHLKFHMISKCTRHL